MNTLNSKLKTLVAVSLLSLSSLASAETVEMDVNGLVCAFCAQGIEKTLKAFPATEAVFVSLENRIVAVHLKEGAALSDEALRKAITEAGYAVTAIRRSDKSLDEVRHRAKAHD